MSRFEYDVTRHASDTFDKVVYFCSVSGQCGIDEITKAVWNGVKRNELSEFVEFLHDYVRLHFNDEQRLMDEHQYPKTVPHKQAHDILKNRVASIQTVMRNPDVRSDELLVLVAELQNDFKNHLHSEDRLLADFIRNQR